MAQQDNQDLAKTMFEFSAIQLPHFFGDKTKDSISPRIFAARVDANKDQFTWTDAATYSNVRLALKGTALEWLIYKEDMVADWTKTWTYLKPKFFKQFISEIEEAQAFSKIQDLKFRHGEDFLFSSFQDE